MFAEIIEEPQLKPGAALRKRRLTNLLSRIKIGLFGAESLRPEFVEGKNVRELNTRLVEELIRRMLSTRYALIDRVYQSNDNPLKFYILFRNYTHDAGLCFTGLKCEYNLLDVAERYPVCFIYVKDERKGSFVNSDLKELKLQIDAASLNTSPAQSAVTQNAL